jgi:hypothetical protein
VSADICDAHGIVQIANLEGLSHNEAEWSSKEQCHARAQTRLNAVLSLDNAL